MGEGSIHLRPAVCFFMGTRKVPKVPDMRRWVCICSSTWSKEAETLKVEVVHEGPCILGCTPASSGVWVSLHLPGGHAGAPGFWRQDSATFYHSGLLCLLLGGSCPPPHCSRLCLLELLAHRQPSSPSFIALLHRPIVLPELPPLASAFLQQFHKTGPCLGLDTSQRPWAQCPPEPHPDPPHLPPHPSILR